MKNALLNNKEIDAAQGVILRGQHGRQLDFRCVECGEPARVERGGGHMPDRFEHLQRNGHCSLVSKPPK